MTLLSVHFLLETLCNTTLVYSKRVCIKGHSQVVNSNHTSLDWRSPGRINITVITKSYIATMLCPFPLQGHSGRILYTRKDVIETVNTCPVLFAGGGVYVTLVSASVVLKYGPGAHLAEARNMRFVQKAKKSNGWTALRLPGILDYWEEEIAFEGSPRQNIVCILMEYIQGPTIESIWSQLGGEEQRQIYQQVCDALYELHSMELAFPGPFREMNSPADVCRGPLFTDYDAGPFQTIHDLDDWFNERLLVCKQFQRISPTAPRFYFEKLVLCHMDVAGRNLIYSGKKEVWFLDWDYAGAYPSYFERATLQRGGSGEFIRGLLDALYTSQEEQEEIQRLMDIGFALTTAAFTKPLIVESVRKPNSSRSSTVSWLTAGKPN
jgi:serine/threonine protein kinase